MSDDQMINNLVSKRQDCIIKFRSMGDILNKYGAWFDGYGNLCVATNFEGNQHLAPSYFHLLGKSVEMKTHHSYPAWCIEREYQDLFEPNMALRAIASGTLSPEHFSISMNLSQSNN